jgi:hypothetical protein
MRDKSISDFSAAPDVDVSRARLIILRALYAFIVAGLLFFVWPSLVTRLPAPPHFQGVVLTMLAAFSILCAVGIRYPLQMLPILLWELLWKCMWLLMVALPRWLDNDLDAATAQTASDCITVVLVLLAVPWGYVFRNYVRKPAERARR